MCIRDRACIKELLAKNLIIPCHEPTEWCSLAFFVVKPDGKNIRMVTDFIRLNSFVQRPVHPFTCVSEILQTIPASAKYFAKMDAVNGYFQIALEWRIIRKNNVPAAERQVLLPQNSTRFEFIIRCMVSPFRRNNRQATIGQENHGRRPRVGAIPARIENQSQNDCTQL